MVSLFQWFLQNFFWSSESGVMLSCFDSARNVLMRGVSVVISMTLNFWQRYGQKMRAEKTV